MISNSVKHARKESTGSVRHSWCRNAPLPLYMSMKIQSAARSRGLVNLLHSLGMCVSYDRLLQSSSDVKNGIYQRFVIEDAVYPSNLRQNLFTTAAVDNIDHNQSSATAIDSFHVTGISVNQNLSHTHGGLDCGVAVLNQDRSSKSTAHLPSTYTSVPPVALRTKNFNAPVVQGPVNNWISWSAYYANTYHVLIPPPASHALLHLFTESPHSTAILRHSKAAVQYLNPGQIPVLTADQQLFAMLKEMRWTFSRPPVKTQSKQKDQLSVPIRVCGLFSRLHISCQRRHGDLDEFSSHENHASPPALSIGGKLRVGMKSDLLHCLESSHSEDRSEALLDATIHDDAAIVQMLSCGTSKTFQEYADTVFALHISTRLQKNCRIDLVWDVDLPDRMREQQERNGVKGQRIKYLTLL